MSANRFRRHVSYALIAVLPLLTAPLGAQQAASTGKAQEPVKSPVVFGAQSSLVLLDIIVRDKKGRPVRDLDPKEIQVYEDGQRRDLTAFRLVEGRASEERVAPREAAGLQPDPSRQVSLVTFVFDKLLDNRQLAEQAALDFLANHTEDNVYMSVWNIDQRLFLRQPFTRDPYLLKQAIWKATGTTSVTAASNAGEAAQQQQFATQAGNTASNLQNAAAGSPGGAGGANNVAIGSANAEAQMASVVAGILRFTDSIQKEQQGQSSIYPLMGLVKAQGQLAGRKTLIYFSEGLIVPKNLQEAFETVKSEANRNNVTIYAVDARGLNSSRDSEAKRQQLLDAARTSQQQAAKKGAGAVTVDEVMIAENAEESLRANVQDTLGELAQATGGFLIANTNDFKTSMARVATDIGSYYEAAYVPVSQEFDGKFRKISVKVTRPGVTVQSRSGYFALPPGEGSTAMLPFEMPLLTALTVDPPPHAFDYQAAALQFGKSDTGRDHVVMFEVPLDKMSFDEDHRKKQYRLQLSILALVRDADGKVVEKFSDDYPFEGPLDKLQSLRQGHFIFKRPFTLPPGQYRVDFVAQDKSSGKTSVQTQTLNVAPSTSCALSTVVVIRRLEEAGPDLPADDPFRVDQMRVVPNLDVPLSKAANSKLTVYVDIYTAPGTTTPPKMALEFMQGDKLIARGTPSLEPPDKDGRIPFVGTIPLDNVAPGTYSVRALAMQGSDVAESETVVTLVP